MSKLQSDNTIFEKAIKLLQDAREQVVRTVNRTIVQTYYEIGKMIVEEEQGGKQRAAYGTKVIKELSRCAYDGVWKRIFPKKCRANASILPCL